MANSFGPPGAGGNPVSREMGKTVEAILPKEVVAKVKQSSQAVSDAVSVFAKSMAVNVQEIKEAPVVRQYNLHQELRDKTKFRREFDAWIKQEATD